MSNFSTNSDSLFHLNLHVQNPEGEFVAVGGEENMISIKSATEAFKLSLQLLRLIIPTGDIYTFEAEGNSTIVREFTDNSLYIKIQPNILEKNTPSIGPYSMRLRKFIADLPSQ